MAPQRVSYILVDMMAAVLLGTALEFHQSLTKKSYVGMADPHSAWMKRWLESKRGPTLLNMPFIGRSFRYHLLSNTSTRAIDRENLRSRFVSGDPE